MRAASPPEALDPDVGRRVLQCGCGETRLHTNAQEAFAEGWGVRWKRERRIWFCPECHVPPAQSHEGPVLPLKFWRWIKGEGMAIAQHSSRSNEHYTPPEITDGMREVFGADIDLDPASSAAANELVRARRFYTKADDGLSLPWEGTVWLNPPGGELENVPNACQRWVSQAAYWWAHLASRAMARPDRIPQAGFLVFNLELLRHAQKWEVPQPLEFDFCIFSDRIRYYSPTKAGPVRGDQPAHPSALIYLGPHGDRFRRVFEGRSFPGGFIRSK